VKPNNGEISGAYCARFPDLNDKKSHDSDFEIMAFFEWAEEPESDQEVFLLRALFNRLRHPDRGAAAAGPGLARLRVAVLRGNRVDRADHAALLGGRLIGEAKLGGLDLQLINEVLNVFNGFIVKAGFTVANFLTKAVKVADFFFELGEIHGKCSLKIIVHQLFRKERCGWGFKVSGKQLIVQRTRFAVECILNKGIICF